MDTEIRLQSQNKISRWNPNSKADATAGLRFDNVKISGLTADKIDALMCVAVKKSDFSRAKV